MPSASMLHTRPLSHSRQASLAASVRSKSGSMNGDEAEEPFLSGQEVEENRKSLSGEERRGKSLENSLDHVGFGAYQWRLLILCGCGWLSDNASLQCVALILPRVQVHFGLSSTTGGLLSACMMAGMMVGSIAWGTLSDISGRSLAFNSTLFFTAVFGIAASTAPTFGILCVWMALLGSAVGGSMPTDGTLFLENLPEKKQYLLTLLSVFFSMGAVMTSILGLIILPGASCPSHEHCNFGAKENDGWRRLLFVLGLINLIMFAARFLLFRLHESPRFLVARDRRDEAVIVLQKISDYNGGTKEYGRDDVSVPFLNGPGMSMSTQGCEDTEEEEQRNDRKVDGAVRTVNEASPIRSSSPRQILARNRTPSSNPLFGSTNNDVSYSHLATRPTGINIERSGSDGVDQCISYPTIGGSVPVHPRLPSTFHTPSEELSEVDSFNVHPKLSRHRSMPLIRPEPGIAEEGSPDSTVMGEGDDAGLPHEKLVAPIKHYDSRLMRAASAWYDRIAMLFVPRWRRTTILMWIIWGLMSLGYGMFNVWLPTVLEERAKGNGAEGLSEALKEFVAVSMAGCPGSLIGAYSIETRLGRRKSLAIYTLGTAFATFAFIGVSSKSAVVASSTILSLAATAMYAVLYGMTPEIFGIEIRGTACGTSAAISRLTGVIAPPFAGFLLSITPSLPLFTSAGVLVVTAVCGLLLPFERVPGCRSGGGIMH